MNSIKLNTSGGTGARLAFGNLFGFAFVVEKGYVVKESDRKYCSNWMALR